MKLAILIAATVWLIAAAIRWATRPHAAPEMTQDIARRIVRQNARGYDTVDAPHAYIAPPLDVSLFVLRDPS